MVKKQKTSRKAGRTTARRAGSNLTAGFQLTDPARIMPAGGKSAPKKRAATAGEGEGEGERETVTQIGRASGRERGCQSVSISVVTGSVHKKKSTTLNASNKQTQTYHP